MKRISMEAKYQTKCNYCMKSVLVGSNMFYDPDNKGVFHPECKLHPFVEVVGRGKMWQSAGAKKKRSR